MASIAGQITEVRGTKLWEYPRARVPASTRRALDLGSKQDDLPRAAKTCLRNASIALTGHFS